MKYFPGIFYLANICGLFSRAAKPDSFCIFLSKYPSKMAILNKILAAIKQIRICWLKIGATKDLP